MSTMPESAFITFVALATLALAAVIGALTITIWWRRSTRMKGQR